MGQNPGGRWMAALLVSACLPGLLRAQGGAATPRPAAGSEGPPTILGSWRGEARLPDGPVEVFFEIEPGSREELAALITVVRLGLRRAPAKACTLRDRKLVIDATELGGAYRGVWSTDRHHVSGFWQATAGPVPLDLARADGGCRRPQEPKRPYPYRDEEVTFVNDQAGITFHGTLTIPKTPGPHPAAVMITGAGCQDRDEAVIGHRPFMVIADQLTRRGIAVLRYDDRGFGETKGSVFTATSEDNATDALAAVTYLSSRPDIDRGRIGLIGHSEGGMVAMMAASRSPDIRFAVSLAGVAEKCEIIADQMLDAFIEGHNASWAVKLAGKVLAARTVAVLKSDATDADAAARLGVFLPPEIVHAIACRWTRFIIRYDPGPAIEKVKCPILGLYCADDGQVPATENAAALSAACARGGNTDVTIVTYPRLNHFFQISSPTAADKDRLDDTIAPDVLDRLGNWVFEKTRVGRPAAESR